MTPLHQIYCTHCTYGTSAVERNDGELANRPLGYGARAASVQGDDLQLQYGLIKRFLYYYLPSDTPGDLKRTLTAQDTPRRLFFQPATNGLQIAGHVCYRTYDSSGRSPGSYFGHVLVRDSKSEGEPLTARDCLRHWGSPSWIVEDGPSLNHDLGCLSSLADLRPGAVNDDTLFDFLSIECSDPGRVVPANVRAWPVEERCKLLQWTLGALLSVNMQRESVILLAEPGLAALVFYGVLRLLPDNLAANISFSTFEKPPDKFEERYLATLVGMRYYDLAKDIAPDHYERLWAANACGPRLRYVREPDKHYAIRMVELLQNDGPQAVLQCLGQFTQLKPELVDLEGLVRADEFLEEILDPSVMAVDVSSSQLGKHGEAYLRLALARRFGDSPHLWQLNRFLGTPVQARLLQLLATDQRPDGAVAYLLARVPTEQVDLVLDLPIPDDDKADVFARAIQAKGKLPVCLLAQLEMMASKPKATSLVPRVIAKLEDHFLREVWNSLASRPKAQEALLECFHRLPIGASKGHALESLLADCSAEQLRGLLGKDKGRMLSPCPPQLSGLAFVLDGILTRLPHYGDPEIWSWLRILRYACRQAPKLEKGVQAWESVREHLKELIEAENVKEGWISGRGKEEKCLGLALPLVDGFLAALKLSDLAKAKREEKLACLERLTRQVLPESAYFFQDRIWHRVSAQVLEDARPSEKPASRPAITLPAPQPTSQAPNVVERESEKPVPPVRLFLELPKPVRWAILAAVLALVGLVVSMMWPKSPAQGTNPEPVTQEEPALSKAPETSNTTDPAPKAFPLTKLEAILPDGPWLIPAGTTQQFTLRIRRTNVTGPITVVLAPESEQAGQGWKVKYDKAPLNKDQLEEALDVAVEAPSRLERDEPMSLKMFLTAKETGQTWEHTLVVIAKPRPQKFKTRTQAATEKLLAEMKKPKRTFID